MTSPDPTRRDFLLKLAKAAAFVPPAMATLSVRPAAGQGKSTATTSSSSSTTTTSSSSVSSSTTGGGKGGNTSSSVTTVGSISPTAQQIQSTQFSIDPQSTTTSPWTGQATQPPPWSRPPPTQTGR